MVQLSTQTNQTNIHRKKITGKQAKKKKKFENSIETVTAHKIPLSPTCAVDEVSHTPLNDKMRRKHI